MSEIGVRILRWLARVSAVIVAGGYFSLMAGEILAAPHSGPPMHFIEWFGIFLLTAAMIAILLAWNWELPGALVSLGCLAMFVSVIRIGKYAPIVVMAAPGLLYLTDWLVRRLAHPPHHLTL